MQPDRLGRVSVIRWSSALHRSHKARVTRLSQAADLLATLFFSAVVFAT